MMGRHDLSTSGQSEKVVEVGLPDWEGLGFQTAWGGQALVQLAEWPMTQWPMIGRMSQRWSVCSPRSSGPTVRPRDRTMAGAWIDQRREMQPCALHLAFLQGRHCAQEKGDCERCGCACYEARAGTVMAPSPPRQSRRQWAPRNGERRRSVQSNLSSKSRGALKRQMHEGGHGVKRVAATLHRSTDTVSKRLFEKHVKQVPHGRPAAVTQAT